jgi:acyl CoA:acetate/3-ketoacid CoA transferase alpha subunit
MTKLWPNTSAALEQIARGGMLLAIGRIGLCGIPEVLIISVARNRRPRLDRRQQQCRRRRLGSGSVVGDASDSQDDLQLCRRKLRSKD